MLGWAGEGNFVIFGDFRCGGFEGSVRGQTTRKTSAPFAGTARRPSPSLSLYLYLFRSLRAADPQGRLQRWLQ